MLVLAFDIERSGAFMRHQTIAIGASVVNEDYQELDSFLACNYRPTETVFEERCRSEFWANNQHILKRLAVDEKKQEETLEEGENDCGVPGVSTQVGEVCRGER